MVTSRLKTVQGWWTENPPEVIPTHSVTVPEAIERTIAEMRKVYVKGKPVGTRMIDGELRNKEKERYALGLKKPKSKRTKTESRPGVPLNPRGPGGLFMKRVDTKDEMS